MYHLFDADKDDGMDDANAGDTSAAIFSASVLSLGPSEACVLHSIGLLCILV